MLNHPLSEALIRTNTSPFRGGYYSIEELMTALIAAPDKLAAARTPRERTRREREAAELWNAIENRVSAVFGLSEADMDTVRAVPVPA